MKHIRKFLWIPLLGLGLAQLPAEVILIDFNNKARSPSTSKNGGLASWNILTSIERRALVDSTGRASGISIHFVGNWITDSDVLGQWQGGDTDWLDADAAQDYFWGHYREGGGTSSIVLSGFDDTQTYHVELVASRSESTTSSRERFMSTQVNGAHTKEDADSRRFNAVTDGNIGGKIMRWLSVTPVSGTITIQIQDPPGNSSYFVNAVMVKRNAKPQSLPSLPSGQ